LRSYGLMGEEGHMDVFYYFFIPFLISLGIFVYKNGKKAIIQDAAEMGWKVTKIKFNWLDYLVNYQDYNGVSHTTHCSVCSGGVKWEEDTDGLFLDQKTYKTKSRIWKITGIVCGLCFLYLFVGYQYEQISWNVFRYSFVKNGNVIKIDNRIAIGLESIIRGDEALKLINTIDPDHKPPQEYKEFVVIKLKIKNLSKTGTEEFSFKEISANRWDSNFELSALTTLPDYRDPLILAKGETTFNSFHGEVAISDPIQMLHLSFYLYEFGYESKELPLSNNPLRGENFSPLMYWFFSIFYIQNPLLNRWYLLLKSKKTKGLILLPICIILVSVITILISQNTRYTADWLNFFMVALFTITWWNIILLASTKPEPATT
jgi:hypothetical protein